MRMHMAVRDHPLSHLHDHELIFEDEDKLDTDYVKMKVCEICGYLMFINASYSCSEEGCNFSIHKECAELYRNKEFLFDTTTYRLSLTPNKDKINKRCTKCFQICNNFTYSTLGRYKNFHFHPLCVERKEIKTKHRSHHEHPMTPTHKKISAVCDACGVDDKKDHFLSCQPCIYWIHKDCALLPPVGMHTSHANHPLILLYSNPFSRQNPCWGLCGICRQEIPIENAAYMCQAFSYFVHLKCVKSEIKPLTPQESRKQIIDLPPSEEEYEVFPSILINNEVQEFKGDESSGTIIKRMTPEECHSHTSLIFHGKDGHHEISGGVCNACIRPISTPFYSCSTETGCRFLVHEVCANLPSTIPRKFGDPEIHLFCTFYCDICSRKCNGFGYSNDEKPSWWSTFADVECASVPSIIKHQSHNHILHLLKSSYFDSTQKQFSCCSTCLYTELLYMCVSCDFKIHVSCALLPKEVSHDFDDHPLLLITNKNILSKKEENENFFCEFCEGDINLHFWFYYCAQCDQLFHVNCIPSVGELSKFKFGGTIDGNSHSSHPHPDHPLTSVRMLNVGSQTCGVCQNKIHGFLDNVALQCSTCDFWIHWNCVRWYYY